MQRHTGLSIVMGIGLAGGIAAPALAQTEGPTTDIAVSMTLRHDTNLARSAAARNRLKETDQRAMVGAELSISRPLGRNTVSANAYVGYDFYRRNTRLNRERISLDANAALNFGPCLVTLAPRISRKQSELNEIAYVDLPDIESVKNTQTQVVYSAEARCGSANGFRPLVRYERSIGNNSNDLRKISNYRGDRYAAGVGYSNPVLGNFDLTLERENLHYPNRNINISTGYQLDQIKLAASRNIGAILVAEGYVAYTRLKPKNGGRQLQFKGVAWSIGGTATPLPALRLHATFSQALQPSLGANALYSRDRDYDIGATYALSYRTSVSLGASRSIRDYRGVGIDVLGLLLDKDRKDHLSARVDFTPSRRLRLGLEVAHDIRNANGSFYDYKNTYIALNSRFSLGGP